VTRMQVLHVSTFLPTLCGIGQYCSDLSAAIADRHPEVSQLHLRLSFGLKGVHGDRHEVAVDPTDRAALAEAVKDIAALKPTVAFLQHEFGLYGGVGGENVVEVLDGLACPIVTTLHTVRSDLSQARREVLRRVVERSSAIIVFSPGAQQLLTAVGWAKTGRVVILPHGVPLVPYSAPGTANWHGLPTGSVRFITVGLLRPKKGIEHVIGALKALVARAPQVRCAYVIAGADHPRSSDAPLYRQELMDRVTAAGLSETTCFIDRFLPREDLVRVIQACDVAILPYPGAEQSSSGVLALAIGCGRPVIASGFQHAVATVERGMGIVYDSSRPTELEDAMLSLALDSRARIEMSQACYRHADSWRWSRVADAHLRIADQLPLTVTV
jgi:glycosyltransferase involved in cell wall biosynthesis